MQSDLTTQSADITPVRIGNGNQDTHADGLIHDYALTVIFTFSFFGHSIQYTFHDTIDVSNSYSEFK